MVEKNQHTVGAEVGGSRVPTQYAADLERITQLVESNPGKIVETVSQLLSKVGTDRLADNESFDGGIFSSDLSNFEKRYIKDYEKLGVVCEAIRLLGHRIVLTSGSFDIIHIGHALYLERASMFGDFLVVGVDSDEKIRKKKGEHRPVVEEGERLQMLAHTRSVDVMALKNSEDEKWLLIKTVRPDTLIATEGTYSEVEVKALEDSYVGRVVVLPPQATTSTTARLRRVSIGRASEFENEFLGQLDAASEFLDPEQLTAIRQIAQLSIEKYFGK
jgi:rfaE bifunctional protein nucleotidyltransferase chain/domain